MGDRGVQGLTEPYSGTKGMCIGTDSGLYGVQGMSIGASRGAQGMIGKTQRVIVKDWGF